MLLFLIFSKILFTDSSAKFHKLFIIILDTSYGLQLTKCGVVKIPLFLIFLTVAAGERVDIKYIAPYYLIYSAASSRLHYTFVLQPSSKKIFYNLY